MAIEEQLTEIITLLVQIRGVLNEMHDDLHGGTIPKEIEPPEDEPEPPDIPDLDQLVEAKFMELHSAESRILEITSSLESPVIDAAGTLPEVPSLSREQMEVLELAQKMGAEYIIGPQGQVVVDRRVLDEAQRRHLGDKVTDDEVPPED